MWNCDGQSDAEAGFLQLFLFPRPILTLSNPPPPRKKNYNKKCFKCLKLGIERSCQYIASMAGWLMDMEQSWERELAGKPKYSERNYPSAILSTTNLTWLELGSNTGRHIGSRLLTAWVMAWLMVIIDFNLWYLCFICTTLFKLWTASEKKWRSSRRTLRIGGLLSDFTEPVLHCHVSGVPWRTINGFWIGWLDLLPFRYNYINYNHL
jgi:hypothetical protein